MSWARALLTIAAVSIAAAALVGLVSRAPAELRQQPAEPDATNASLGSSFSDEQVTRHAAYRRPGYLALGLGLVVQVVALVVLARGPWGRLVDGLEQRVGAWPLRALLAGAVVALILTIAALPLAYVRGYVIEHAWGLSTQAPPGWIVDQAKGAAVGAVTAAIAAAVFFAVVRWQPRTWWVVGWAAFTALTAVMFFLWPVVIAPLFNRFTPLEQGPLNDRFHALAAEAGVPVDEVLVADASRRTTAENAYVAGLGSTKRLVLYDTLLVEDRADQTAFVVAHELGHQAKNHVLKNLGLSAIGLAAAFAFLGWLGGRDSFWEWAGATGPGDLRALPPLVLLSIALTVVSMPFEAALSRRFEAEADRVAIELTDDPAAAVAAFRRLALANLADLDPPPLAVAAFYSHPPIPERIDAVLGHKGLRPLNWDHTRPAGAPLLPAHHDDQGGPMPAETLIERFQERIAEHPESVALRYKSGGAWKDITWRDYGSRVRRSAKALMAQGLGHGEKMSLLSLNRPEWHVADIACLSIGAATAPIYVTNSPEQVAYIVGHSESKIAVVENPDQLQKVLKMRSDLPALQKVVVIEGYQNDADPELVMTWDDFLKAGDSIPDADFDAARAKVEPKDLATFVYTSGTTGPPKAVMLTHANIMWTARSSEAIIPLGEATKGKAVSYLPLSHIAERMLTHFLQIYYGTTTCFAESLDTLLADLQAIKPTYFFGVPRVWEKFYAGVQAKMAQADPNDRKTKLARKAIGLGKEITKLEQEAVARGGKITDAKIPLGTKLQHAALDKVVLHKIRAAFGLEELELALSSAAPLSPELIWFFHSIGLKIAEGYGQSEDNGPTAWNPPDGVLIGSVGKPMPGLEVKLAEDGEILVRGGNIMAGYYKDDQATRETIDEDGWLHSGDVGEFNEHGYLKITDRKKDLIITAGGKNIAPQELENKIKVHPLISQVVAIGDRRPFMTCLITLDPEKAPVWAKEQGIDGDMAVIAGHERTIKEIEGAINETNKGLAKVEQIKKFRILERDFLQEENEITPTMKVKRKTINEIYGDAIEEMYSKESPPGAAIKAPLRK